MSLNIYMLSARDGDCFLIQLNHKYILIDGGYSDTYHNILKDKLSNISKISLAIITHIDRDHIEGMIELFKYNGFATKPNLIKVDQIWYNSYNSLPKELVTRKLSWQEKEILRGYVLPSMSLTGIEDKPINGTQGMSLSYYLAINGYYCNETTNGKAICIENMTSYKLDEDTTITLLTPTLKQLADLANAWSDELKRKKWSFELTDDMLFNGAMEAFLLSDANYIDAVNKEISGNTDMSVHELSMLSSLPDNSVTNASSISLLIQFQNRTLLFLSDAPEKKVVESLKNLGITYFDVIKISHHGALKNSNKIFEYIDGEYFLISTDGVKYNHPDLGTLAKIVSRPCNKARKLIFNYSNKAYNYFNNKDLMEKYKYTVHIITNNEPIII